jgi:hypothetical protein
MEIILETLIMTLGPSIAKLIFNKWLGDSVLANEINTSVVDLIRKKTHDIVTQRQANRQFETIGEKVAMNILPIFEMDGVEIDEDEQRLVIKLVAENLNAVQVSPDILAKKNLEPSALASYITEKCPRPYGLSDMGSNLYERVLNESCQYIVDIASQFPSFSEKTFSEILKRETVLLNVTNQVLDEVKRIRDSSSKELRNVYSQFETEYRRYIIRNFDQIELFGADLSDASRRHQLSVAYIMLSVAYMKNRVDKKVIDHLVKTDLVEEALKHLNKEKAEIKELNISNEGRELVTTQ